jgi:hypothetical protein
VALISGERYYFLTRRAEVAMMPASVVEANKSVTGDAGGGVP